MGPVMAILPAVMAGVSLAGTAMSTIGAIRQGQQQKLNADYEALQMEKNAKQIEAAGQQAALEKRRQYDIAQSRALAIAGASGAGALDPDVLNIIGGLNAEGERAFGTELYNARSNVNAMTSQAAATRYQGQQAQTAGYVRGAATALSGIADAAGMTYFGQTSANPAHSGRYIDFQRGISRPRLS